MNTQGNLNRRAALAKRVVLLIAALLLMCGLGGWWALRPPPLTQVYTNDDVGFSLQYPDGWSVREIQENNVVFSSRLYAHHIQLFAWERPVREESFDEADYLAYYTNENFLFWARSDPEIRAPLKNDVRIATFNDKKFVFGEFDTTNYFGERNFAVLYANSNFHLQIFATTLSPDVASLR